MAARQDVEKAKKAVINAKGMLVLEDKEVSPSFGLHQEVNHMSNPKQRPRIIVQELGKLLSSQRERDELRAEFAVTPNLQRVSRGIWCFFLRYANQIQ